MTLLFYTSANFAYQDKVLTLAASLKNTHPDSHFTWLVVEPKELKSEVSDLAKLNIDRILFAEDLEIPNFHAWMFEHDVVEACTAVKGPYLRRTLDGLREGTEYESEDFIIYVDPDLFFLDSIKNNLEKLREEDRSVLLTPHLVTPPSDQLSYQRNEKSVLKHGAFNLGFLAVRPTPVARHFASWWESRLLLDCFDDLAHGVFTDQKWVDLSPAYFGDQILIDRDPGLNFATWNASERKLMEDEGQFWVDGSRLKFVHFTAFTSGGHFEAMETLPARHEAFRSLTRIYSRAIEESAVGVEPRAWGYGALEDGTKIKHEWRQAARGTPHLWANSNPFESGRDDPRISPWRVRDIENLVRQFPKFEHTDWQRLRNSFRRLNSLSEVPLSLDGNRISELSPIRETLTHITHGLGGGLDEAIRIMSDVCRDQFDSIQIWKKSSMCGGLVEQGSPTSIFALNDLAVSEVLSEVSKPQSRATIIHSRIGWSREDLLRISDVSSRCVIYIHDFSWCLADWTMASYGGGDFQEWIMDYSNDDVCLFSEILFQNCDEVFCPSHFVMETYSKIFPRTKFSLLPHFETPRPELNPVSSQRLQTSYSKIGIGVVGNYAKHKGGSEIIEMISGLSETHSSLMFHLFGEFPESWNGFQNCVVHGFKERQYIVECLRKYVDVGWLPSLVPETYSFALSDLMKAGLPIVAKDRGALRERLQGRPMTHCYDGGLSIQDFIEVIDGLREQAVRGLSNDGAQSTQPQGGVANSSTDSFLSRDGFVSALIGSSRP